MATLPLNPIIPGAAADPSICLIGDTYFLVNSSFQLFPNLPIYTSKDLVNWRHIGNAINRPGQLSLRGATTFFNNWPDGSVMLSTGGTYAPTIRHHAATGKTYILCTNVIHNSAEKADGEHGHNFIIHTTDIWSSKWSDPVYYEFHGIDPSIFFDDESGKAYIQGSKMPEFQIYNMEVDLSDDTKVTIVTPPKLIWAGWDKRYTESPHLHKKDGWWYLICAEGGTFDTHMISMARSRNVWGPYEACDRNPVLTAHGTDRYVQNTGHADFFQDTEGNWWAIMLGVRQRGDRFIMGRETFLTSVEWSAGGWPVVSPVTEDGTGRVPTSKRTGCPIVAENGADWVYLRDPELSNFTIDGDAVTMVSSAAGLATPMEPVSFVGKRQRRLQGEATVLVRVPNGKPMKGLFAGLAVYKDEHRYAEVSYSFENNAVGVTCCNMAKQKQGARFERSDLPAGATGIQLRLSHTEMEYTFAYRANDTAEWISFNTIDTVDLTGFDFTGPIVGIFATGEDGHKVQFEAFKSD